MSFIRLSDLTIEHDIAGLERGRPQSEVLGPRSRNCTNATGPASSSRDVRCFSATGPASCVLRPASSRSEISTDSNFWNFASLKFIAASPSTLSPMSGHAGFPAIPNATTPLPRGFGTSDLGPRTADCKDFEKSGDAGRRTQDAGRLRDVRSDTIPKKRSFA